MPCAPTPSAVPGVDPRRGEVTLAEYAGRWLEERPDLRPRTQELYESYLRLHILPALGRLELAQLTSTTVRTWHAHMLRVGRPGRSTVAKCHRLLKTVLGTAVEDELIAKNPCVVKGAGVERPAERPTATVPQVYALAEAVAPRWRVLVLTATFAGLRLGELQGLKRRNVNLLHGTVKVVEQTQAMNDGTLFTGPPKAAAGLRTVNLPAFLIGELEAHLSTFSVPRPDGLVFPGAGGAPFRRGTVNTAWKAATAAVGIEGLRFHDLRHTGNTWRRRPAPAPRS